ncbi:MAG: carboxypeptidase-like regulatory domain-containing protein, partial [Hymenobacteraceae bacterium]|nr:carboxypeptidase-like regulatory domain-containing protein [Hymenobacteraceae bacterium]MDX5397210.1 carboxypeptidase-like regulatory domain-containing protein [Hymenobacteraceae bacterium]MDX5513286.1 carboxypeptidase-like regulatory domain-containing protein [Hymenobacteraceae bacterium]
MKTIFNRLTLLLLLMSLFTGLPAQAQEKVTLSGYLKDKASGEGLIGATVSVKELADTGTGTNEYGFYSLTVPKGTYTFVFSYIGYNPVSR